MAAFGPSTLRGDVCENDGMSGADRASRRVSAQSGSPSWSESGPESATSRSAVTRSSASFRAFVQTMRTVWFPGWTSGVRQRRAPFPASLTETVSSAQNSPSIVHESVKKAGLAASSSSS